AFDDALVKEKKFHLARDESRAATAAARAATIQQSPTAPLRHMLQNTTILQYPQAPFQQPQFHQCPSSPSPQQSAPANRGQTLTHAPFTFRSNELQAADACANALQQHPDTPAGLALYAAQITSWNKAFPGRLKANEYCPYPLTPGTVVLGSNKCF